VHRPGIENFSNVEARAMAAEDPDHHIRDLYEMGAPTSASSWSTLARPHAPPVWVVENEHAPVEGA